MNSSLPNLDQKIIQLPLWVVYKKDKETSQWIPQAAFICRNSCVSWSSVELGASPSADMSSRHTSVYATRQPICNVFVLENGTDFRTTVQDKNIQIIDLIASPKCVAMIEHTMSMLHEFRHFQSHAKEDKAGWDNFRSILRALTEDDLLLAPRFHV